MTNKEFIKLLKQAIKEAKLKRKKAKKNSIITI
jgi:hypothetical protein